MPIYEYRCLRCEQLSEFLLRVSDPQPESCPRCGEAGSLRKQISQTSFSLKGEGWYVTDYKKTASDKTKEGEPEAVTGNPDSKETKPPSVEGGADGPAKTAPSAATPKESPAASGNAAGGKDSSSSGSAAGGGSSGS